jgi:yecA family protein
MAALSEADIERLATRLAANQSPTALSLEGVDGLFCALIASPTMIGPSAYLPVILGADPANTKALTDLKAANDTLSLLVRYWNAIVADFSDETVHRQYSRTGLGSRLYARHSAGADGMEPAV